MTVLLAPLDPGARDVPAPTTASVRVRFARGTSLRDRVRLAAVCSHPDLARMLTLTAREPTLRELALPAVMALAGSLAVLVGTAAVVRGASPAMALLAAVGLVWIAAAGGVVRRLLDARHHPPPAYVAVVIGHGIADEAGDRSVRLLLADGRHLELWTTAALAEALAPGDAGVAYGRGDRLCGFWRAR